MRISFKEGDYLKLTEEINSMTLNLKAGTLRIYFGKQNKDGMYSGGYMTEQEFEACCGKSKKVFLELLYNYIVQNMSDGVRVLELRSDDEFGMNSNGFIVRYESF